ncbi:phage distal tail protein [Streptomyces sp. NPDC014889]|uniref:phage distal tail protein n=1 Tax=Streptomyces sp. NPDC014889 TaxID=3364928 RepID=UPI0037033B2F
MVQQALGRIQWGDLTFGPGSPYTVTALEGLDDLPEIRSEDVPRPGQHGDYSGPDYTTARTIALKLGLRAETPDGLRELSLALRNATQPQMQPAPLQFLDQGALVYGKVRRRSIPYDAEYLWRIGDAALEFYCADSYLYSLEEKSASTTAYSPAAGREYPRTYGGTASLLRNLALNPSVAGSLSNTQNYGAASRILASEGYYGNSSVQHTSTGTSTAGTTWSITPQTGAGTVITASCWVKLPTSGFSEASLTWRSGTTVLATASVSAPTSGQWERISATYTLQAGETCDRVGVGALPTATGLVWLADGLMAETGPVLHDYVDGDQPGCVWESTANASPSHRLATAGRAYGSAGTSGRVTAYNAGGSPAYPVLRLDGPVANPAIEQVTTGGSLVIDATLQAGEYLLIDTRSRAVLLMGSSPRRSWVRGGSSWPLLRPGHNELAYRGNALPGIPDQSSLLTVTWRDTSL